MSGRLNDVLPEPISEENEKVLLEHLKRKMKSACGLSVRLLPFPFCPEGVCWVPMTESQSGSWVLAGAVRISPKSLPSEATSGLHG